MISNIETPKILDFSSKEEATDWLESQIDDTCIDNHRFAYLENPYALIEYQKLFNKGCCGFFDVEITINGKLATIGCNYGH